MIEILKRKSTKIGIAVIILVVAIGIISISVRSAQKQREYDGHVEAAERYLTELDYEQAIAEYTLALEIEPNNEEVLNALEQTYLDYAQSLADSGEYEKAISVLEEGYAQTGRESLRERLEELKTIQEQIEAQVAELILELASTEYDSFGLARGSIIIAQKDGSVGAINTENEIVIPFEYDAWQSIDDNGNIVLLKASDDEPWKYIVFDANGNKVHESYNETIVSNGMYIQNCYGEDGADSTIDYYNMDGTLVISLPYYNETTGNPSDDKVVSIHGFYDGISITDVIDGSVGGVNDTGDVQWSGVKDWSVGSVSENSMIVGDKTITAHSARPGFSPMNSMNHGYFVSRLYLDIGEMALMDENYEMVAGFDLYLVQGDEENGFIPEFANRSDWKENNGFRGFYHDGDYYYNYGTNMVWILEGKDVLVDFSLSPNMTVDTMDNVIVKAIYDRIYMNDADEWLVMSGEQWGYIDHDGNELAMFDDATDFYGQYAVVIEDGTAYVINEKFEKIQELGDAESVRCMGDLFVVDRADITYLYRFK